MNIYCPSEKIIYKEIGAARVSDIYIHRYPFSLPYPICNNDPKVAMVYQDAYRHRIRCVLQGVILCLSTLFSDDVTKDSRQWTGYRYDNDNRYALSYDNDNRYVTVF